ncbi:MAG: hypothetical protein ABI388_07950, partial [Bacteroidia bacterium]
MKQLLLFCGFLLFTLTAKAQTSYTWNGTTSTAYSVATNWTPNGVPGATDNVTIVTGSNACILSTSRSVTNLTITTGTLDLGSNTLTSIGVVSAAGGQCNNGTLSATGATQTFSGTTFGANISVIPASTNDVYFNGSKFNGSVTVTRNNTGNIQSTGNNIFSGTTSITNTGTGYLLLTNTSARPDVFNGLLTLNTTNTGNLYIGWVGTATYNANVTVNNTASTAITYLGGSGGTTNLGAGVTITCGTFAGGSLNISKLVQADATAINLNPGINGGAGIYASSTVTGNLTITAGNVYTQASTFNGTVTLNKTGGTNNASTGGNTFNNTLTMNHSGIGYWGMGNGTKDIFNGDLYLNNTCANERILIGQSSTGNQLNGNVFATESGSAQGIWLGYGGTFPVIAQAAGKAINVSSATFTTGYLNLYGYAQTGAAALNYSLGTNSGLGVYNSTINGTLTLTAGNIYTQLSTFATDVVLNKTGGTNNPSAGGNTFNGLLTMNHTGVGYWGMGNGAADIFNGDVYLNNNCTNERILIGQNSSNNMFNGNVYVTSGGAAQNITLGYGGTFPVVKMAAGKSVFAGGAGLTAGGIVFNEFTQSDATAISLTGTGTSYINATGGSVFTGATSFNAPDVYSQGATYNAPVVFTKTGGGSDHNNGNLNTFNSTCTINQQSNTGYFMLGFNANDQFNDNIIVTSTGTGGINLGWTGGSGQPVLANGKTLTVGGAGFSAGYLRLGSFQAGTSPVNLNLTGNSAFYVTNANSPCLFGGSVNVTAADLYIAGGIFNGATTFVKTGGTSNHNGGFQNIFNSTLEIDQQSSNYFMLGYNSNDLFNGDITVTSIGTGAINLGYSNGTGTPTLAAGKTILIGAAGYSAGQLYFGAFTQLGNAPINLTLTGTTTLLTMGNASVFGGSFTAVSPRILLNGATYAGNVNMTKNGAAGEWSNGGNIFNGTTTINQLGGGFFGFANGAPDIYNGDLYVNNNSTDRVIFANSPVGNQFNGNIILTQIGSSTGIAFGWSASTNETLAAGKTISIGAAGYNVGYLQIAQFTQLGNVAMNLPLTGTASLTFGPTSTIGGNVTSTSGSLFFNTTTFNGTVNSTKTGATNDGSSGGNIFTGASNFTNSGSGYLMFGNGSRDQFLNTSTFNNTGSSNIYVGYNSVNNVFNGVATFNNTPTSTNSLIYVANASANNSTFNDNIVVSCVSGAGVSFGNSTGTSTLTAGKTITIGAGGFNAGQLILKQFTQVSATPQSLTATGTAYIVYGPTSSFDGNVTSVSPGLYFNGCTFNGTTTCTKNGTSGDYSVGGNIFNGVSNITNSGSSFLLLGNSSPDTWNNDVTFTNNGSERILPCYATIGNQFNGNIYVNTAGSAQGITFCGGNGVATATLAATKTIAAGGTGLTAGYLILKQFTQLGNAAINLTLSSTASYLQYGPISNLGGNVTSSSPGLYFHGCTFNGTTTCTKTGASSDASNGGNIFTGTSIMTNNGSGYLLFGNGTNDQFLTAATFNNTGSNNIFLAYNSVNNIFNGVITLNNTPTSASGYINV